MAIFRPRVHVSRLEWLIYRLRRTVEIFPSYRSELRMYERMRSEAIKKHRIKCCDIPRAQSEDASRKKGE